MKCTILTNCRGVAATPDRNGIQIHSLHQSAVADHPGSEEVFGTADWRQFVAGDWVHASRTTSDDGDYTLCEDRAGGEWWIPTHKLS